MNDPTITGTGNSPRGAYEINRRARAQETYLSALEAAWMAEARPARLEKRGALQSFFAGLRAGLSLTGRQLVSVSRK